MADSPKASANNIPKLSEDKNFTEFSREDFAKNFSTPIDMIPQYEGVIKMTKNQLSDLSDLLGKTPVVDRARILKEKITQIKAQEVADKAREFQEDTLKGAKKGLKDLAAHMPEVPPEVSKIASKVSENLSTGTAAIGAAGAAVMAAPTIEGKAKAMDGVMSILGKGWDSVGNFFGGLFDAIMALFSGKFSEALNKFKGIFGMGEKTPEQITKEKTEGVLDKGKEVLISKEEMYEKIKKQYWDKLKASGYIKEPADKQLKKFQEVFDKYQKDGMVDITTQAIKDASSNKEWNLFDTLGSTVTIQGKFALSLLTEGVIPMEAVGASVLDIGKKSLRLWLKSPYTLIDKGAAGFLGEFGEINGQDITKMTEPEKSAVLGILHHNMVIPLYVAGFMTSTLAKIGLMGAYWDQGTGVTKLKFAGNAITGDFAKATDQLDDLMKMFTPGEITENYKGYISKIKTIIDEAQVRGRITEIYTQMSITKKGPKEIASALDAMKGELIASGKTIDIKNLDTLISDVHASGDMSLAREKIVKHIQSAPGSMDFWSRVKGTIRSVPMNDLDLALNNAQNTFSEFNQNLTKVINNADFAPARIWNNIRAAVKGTELIHDAEKGHLTVKVQRAEDAKGIIEQITKAVPNGFSHFFSALSVTVIVADVAAKEGMADKMATAAKDIASLNPVYGGILLMHEGSTMEGFAPTKIGYFVMGGAVFALGAKDLVRLVANPSLGGTMRFAFSPIYAIADASVAGIRGINLARHAVTLGGVRGLAPFVRLRAIGLYGVAAGIGYLIYNNLLKEETTKEMKKAGFFLPDGSLDENNIKTNLAKIPKEKQTDVVNDIIGNLFSQNEIEATYNNAKNTTNIHISGHEKTLMFDQIDNLRKILTDMGINSEMVLSIGTTNKITTYIQSLPVSDSLKAEFAGKYGITLPAKV